MAEECNVANLDDLEIVTTGNFNNLGNNALSLRVLPFAADNGGSVKLLDSNNPGSVTGIWINEPQRVAEGFLLSLDYTASGGTSDGFAVVFQNERLESTVSGGGEGLGFSGSFESYVAVALDFCSDRDERTCDEATLRVETRLNGGNVQVDSLVIPNGLVGSQTLNIQFIELPTPVLTVTVAGETLIISDIGDFRQFLGGEDDNLFSFVGLTGSSLEIAGSALEAVDLEFTNIDLTLMNSQFRLESLNPISTDAANGDLVVFKLEFVDSCGTNLNAIPDGVVLEDITAILIPNDNANQELKPLENGTFVDPNDPSKIVITIPTPENLEETWTLDVLVGDVRVQRMPVENFVTSEVGEAGGLSRAALFILIAVIVALVLIVGVIARQGKKNRDNLKKHKTNIAWGEAKEETKRIDKEVTLQMSPLMLPLEEINKKLAENEALLNKLRDKNGNFVDSDKKVKDLKEKNEALRAQVAELKKKNEYADAVGDGGKESGGSGRFRKKKEKNFLEEQEQI